MTYTTDVLVEVTPLKYDPAGKPRISTAPGTRGTAPAASDAAAALAAVSDAPTPSRTNWSPEFTKRYCRAGRVVAADETACADVGAVVAAVKDTVSPVGLKALTSISDSDVVALGVEGDLGIGGHDFLPLFGCSCFALVYRASTVFGWCVEKALGSG